MHEIIKDAGLKSFKYYMITTSKGSNLLKKNMQKKLSAHGHLQEIVPEHANVTVSLSVQWQGQDACDDDGIQEFNAKQVVTIDNGHRLIRCHTYMKSLTRERLNITTARQARGCNSSLTPMAQGNQNAAVI
jgi:hypothetical protein